MNNLMIWTSNYKLNCSNLKGMALANIYLILFSANVLYKFYSSMLEISKWITWLFELQIKNSSVPTFFK